MKSTTTECTCKDRKLECSKSREAWKIKYPKSCDVCDSWGGFYSQSGDGYNDPVVEFFDPCAHCCEKDLCPLCGSHWPGQSDGDIRRPTCEYDLNSRERGFLPPYNDDPCNFCLKQEYDSYMDCKWDNENEQQ